MKLIIGLLTVGLVTASVTFAQEIVSQGLYSLKKTKEPKTLVARVNGGAVKANHLAEYEVQRQETENQSGKMDMVLYNQDSKQKIELRTQTFSSVSDAEIGVLNLLNSQSSIYTNGSLSGRPIGDNVWHSTQGETGATTIIFIRNNVVVLIFARQGVLVDPLAVNLDADILAGKNGIELRAEPAN